jgi:predicted anti-sigma-YlaC factor YlaD
MDHQSAKELFSQFLDGELPSEQVKELEAHLDQCDTCRTELEALKKTLSSLAGLAPVPPPQDFGRKVQQRIKRRSRGRFFPDEHWIQRVPWEWISFVIIMLMLVMYYMLIQAQVNVKPEAPASMPASQPTSQPASQPAEPATQPVEKTPRTDGAHGPQ